MVISCSDSRVDPETIFSAMPGELFILRNIANLVPPYETGGMYHGVSAAIEFGVLNLRVKHLIVIGSFGLRGRQSRARSKRGHSNGSAVHFAMDVDARTKPGLPFSQTTKANPRQHNTQHLKWKCVKTSIKNLRTFPFVKNDEDRGHLSLHGAHFDIKTGTLSVLNHSRGAFLPL